MDQVYLIGNAHIDPVWLWKKAEGLSEIKSTFRSALDRMKEFPDYIFTCACAAYYEWIEQIDPQMFDEIKQRVKEGQWEIAGGMWIQPDCNLPCGEAFVRQILYSQLYFKEKFGKFAEAGYNVDSFGHNGMLPQILKKGGMNYYVFMRPDQNENSEIPEALFYWESPDGSKVLTHRLTLHYGDTYSADGEFKEMNPCERKAIQLTKLSQEKKLPYLCFYGIGNHGGGPTIRGLRALDGLCTEKSEIRYGSLDRYFHDIAHSDLTTQLSTYSSDLQHHASGCYSALSKIKKANRRAESALITAERMDWLSKHLLNVPCHKEQLKSAWKNVMFNQFHDILAGCCIKGAYDEADTAYAAARNTAIEIEHLALQRIAWNIKTTDILNKIPCQKNGWILWEKEGEGAPVVVFNPHSFPVVSAVQLNIKVSKVIDVDGKSVAIQYVCGQQTNGLDRENTIFEAVVPAFGYSLYYLYKEEESVSAESMTVKPDSLVLENNYLRVKFNERCGTIESFFDKEAKRELSNGAMAKALIIDDSASDTWAHGVFAFDRQVGCFDRPQFCVLDQGSVRTSIRVTQFYNASTLIQDFILYADKKELEVRCRLDFHEKWKIVKLSFPLHLNNTKAIYSMPYGFLSKEANGLEEPSQKWVVAAEENSDAGVALVNDCKYSFSCKDSELRMIVARGTAYADHFGKRDEFMEFQDQGEQEFCYHIMPCSTKRLESVVRAAELLNQPLNLVMETHHNGILPSRYSEVQISTDNVIMETIKAAEYSDGTVIRLYEIAGRETNVKIDIDALNCHFQATLKCQEIKTFYIPQGDHNPIEVNLLEQNAN